MGGRGGRDGPDRGPTPVANGLGAGAKQGGAAGGLGRADRGGRQAGGAAGADTPAAPPAGDVERWSF